MRIFLFLAVSAIQLLAQVAGTGGAGSEATNLPSLPIGANDLLAVSVYDSPELTRTVRVSEDGHIRLPMLPGRLSVKGKLAAEVEQLIAAQLVKAQILVDPVVTVSVAGYQSRPIHVIGAVRNPLTFQAAGPTRLLDALAELRHSATENRPK